MPLLLPARGYQSVYLRTRELALQARRLLDRILVNLHSRQGDIPLACMCESDSVLALFDTAPQCSRGQGGDLPARPYR